MTMGSITKGLVKAWKTSTFVVVAALSILIFSLANFTEVSLAGVSTFGLLLVALQALHMTKEQVGEWRRKEAYLLCEDLEQNYKHIGIDITQTINNIKWMNKNSTHSYYALCKILPLITSGSKNTAYGKCIKYLDFINLHFEAIGKAGTIEARDLIGAVYLLHLKINASNNIPDEKVDEEEIKTAINRINETSIAFE